MKAYRALPSCAALLTVILLNSSTAQDVASPVGEPPTIEELKKSVADLEKQIAARQERATELTNDMLALDTRVEKRVDGIIDSLDEVTDSRETRDKVEEVKRKAMVALRKCTKHYETNRNAVRAEIEKDDPRVTREELFKDLGKFDQRLGKRVDQVVELIGSLQQPEEYERWSYKHDSGLGGYGSDDDTRDPNFYGNKRASKRTKRMRDQVQKELRESISRLDSQNQAIRNRLDGDVSPEYKKVLEDEQTANQDRIDALELSITKLTIPEESNTTPIGKKQGKVLDTLVRDMAEDLERDCDSIFRVYRELNQERKALKVLGERRDVLKSLLPKDNE